MNLIIILIIFLVVVFLGYPFILKEKTAKQSPELKEIDDYIEAQVRSLRSSRWRSAGEGRKKDTPADKEKEITAAGVKDLCCPSCGKKISADDRFCTSCGEKLKK